MEKICQTLEDIQESLDYGAKSRFCVEPQPRDNAEVWNPVTALDIEDLDSPPVLSEDLRKALQWLVGTSELNKRLTSLCSASFMAGN